LALELSFFRFLLSSQGIFVKQFINRAISGYFFAFLSDLRMKILAYSAIIAIILVLFIF